jgi:reactive chlorine resistance protein C
LRNRPPERKEHDMTIIRETRFIRAESALADIGGNAARYGLVVVIAWIGALKFTSYEAHGIQPLVANSPLMSWVYDIFSVTTFSALLGVLELTTAALLAVKPWLPRISAAGSVVAVGLFVATLTFLFTTPGVGEASAGGFPVLSSTGQFLIKDVALIGISLWTLADSLAAARRRSGDTSPR